MSDDLVNSLKSEAVDVSSDESKLEQEGSRQRDSDSDERQRDSVGDNDDDEEEEEEEEEEQEERQDRRLDDKRAQQCRREASCYCRTHVYHSLSRS